MSAYGCNNCYNPLSSEPANEEILTRFYIQDITGRKYLIALCQSCQELLHEIEDRDSINEGVNFIQSIIKKSANYER
jgi:hypothetical protein